MKTKVYNFKGEIVEEIDLPDDIFAIRLNQSLIHQVFRWYLMNNYYPYAHTKTRAEVQGGGKKPWRQKGTGRARHGSIRSPIWVGGGVTFGPRNEKKRNIKINKKMRRKAILMALSAKLKESFLKVIDKIEPEKYKTKEFEKFFTKFLQPRKTKKKRETGLLVIESNKAEIFRSVRNLPYADVIEAKNLNLWEILNHKYLFLSKEAIEVIRQTFLKK